MTRSTPFLATFAAVLLLGAAAPIPGPSDESPARRLGGRVYRLDAAHSQVEFTARYLRMMDVRGRFREWDAAVLDPENPERGAIAVVFKTASLDTGNETRDNHLKSGDFFDVEAHPAVVFTSARVERRGSDYIAHGHLTMKGTTKPLSIVFRTSYAPTTDAKGNRRAGFVGEVTIDRKEFGVVGGNRFNAGFDPLVSIIDDDVRIAFGIHAMIAPVQAAPVDSLVREVERAGVAAVVGGWHTGLPAGDGEEAKKARQRAAGVFNAAGYRMMDMGRDREAVELMRVAVLAAPGSARALAGLAEAQARAGSDAGARENVEQALQADPLEARALVLRTWLDAQ